MENENKKGLNVPPLRFPGFEGEWTCCKIKNLLKIKNGCSQKDVENPNGEYPIYGTGGIIGRSSKFLYNKPSVCIGRKGTIDKPIYLDKPFWAVDTLFYSEIFVRNSPKFIYYLFQTINWMKYNQSTGVPSLTSSAIEGIDTYIPPIAEQHKITNFLSLIDQRIVVQRKTIEDLEKVCLFQSDGLLKLDPIVGTPLSKILFETNKYAKKDEGFVHVTLSKEGITPKTDRYNRDFLVKSEDIK